MLKKEVVNSSGFNVLDDLKELPLDEIQSIQRASVLPYSVAAFNLDGNLNLGNIIRTAVIFSAEKVFIIGKKKYDKRSTVGAHNYIDLDFVHLDADDPANFDEIFNRLSVKYVPTAVEQCGADINDYPLTSVRRCYVFGSESHGFPKDFLSRFASIISIKQYGVMRSLNVSSAAAIVMHKVASDFNWGVYNK